MPVPFIIQNLAREYEEIRKGEYVTYQEEYLRK
jgi:hypothetical protein